MSHVTRVNEPYHARIDESCHTYEWVISHVWSVMLHAWLNHISFSSLIWMSHAARVCMSHVTHESCHTYKQQVLLLRKLSHISTSHVNGPCTTWRHGPCPWRVGRVLMSRMMTRQSKSGVVGRYGAPWHVHWFVEPITDKVAHHLEILSQTFLTN